MRKIDFENNEYYHIYNRGVDKRDVFLDGNDYWKFFDCLRDFNNKTYYKERLCTLGISKDNPKELSSFESSFEKNRLKVIHRRGYLKGLTSCIG